MLKKVMFFIILTGLIPAIAFGKECNSELGAHFKPLMKEMRLYWAAELMFAAGTMNNSILDQNYNNRNFYVAAASVMRDFAREGDFCSVQHVRRLLRGGRLSFNHADFGFSNFAAGVLRWNPNYEKPQKIESADDDEDSFSDAFLQFSSFEEKKLPLLEYVDFISYHEFGKIFHSTGMPLGILTKK